MKPKTQLRHVLRFVLPGLVPAVSAWAQTSAPAPTEVREPAQTLRSVTVTGEREGRYGPTTTDSSKLDVPAKDLPTSQSNVTRAVIEDRRLQQLDEAVDTVAGVRRAQGFPGATGYFVRGFFESYALLRDGFRENNSGPTDLVGIERLEVLKGPGSVLYGGNLSAGGVINLVTRKPQTQPFGEVALALGSDRYRRFSLDSTGPLDADRKLLYRVGLGAQSADSYRDFVDRRQVALSPSIEWRPTASDTLLVQTDYSHARYKFETDFPILPVFLQVPLSRSLAEPGLGGTQSTSKRLTVDYRHEFAPGWKLRVAGNVARFHIDIGPERVYNVNLQPDGRTIARTTSEGPQSTLNNELQAELYGDFATGSIGHKFVVGAGTWKDSYQYKNDFRDLGTLDLFAPVYGTQPGPLSTGFAGRSTSTSHGFFAQDLLSLSEQWKALLAVRRDQLETLAQDLLAGPGADLRTTDQATTYRVGAVYQPLRSTALYLATSSSFVPNVYYASFGGAILKPTLGKQWEFGVKQSLIEDRLSATAALFQIKRQNVPTADVAHPGFYANSGEQRSRGFEADLNGRLAAGWNLTASYAYIDAVVTADASLPVGDRLGGVPRNAVSLFSRYDFQTPLLQGLGLGLGIYHVSTIEAALPNTFTLKSNTRWDGAVYYRFANRMQLAVNGKNLNNVKSYDTDGAYSLRPNAPRTVVASLTVPF